MNMPIIRNGWEYRMAVDEDDNPVFIVRDGDSH